MAIYRNQAGQKIAVFAYTPADGQPTTGDAANITAYLSKDWAAPAAITDTNPTELDAVNMPGWYVFDLAQAETDAEVLIVAPQSATAGVVLDQVQVFTLDATISSRAPAATALANTIWTDGRAALLDYLDAGAIADEVIAGMGDLVEDVWSHTTRTLTSPATGADDSTTATAITRRRGDDWSIAVSSLELAGYQEVWFTIKRGYDALDSAAKLMVTETGGLERLNGAAPAVGEAAKAALTVNAGNDTATITVEASITAQLPTGQFDYDLQWKDASNDIYTVSLGTFTISGDVTRATS